MQKGRSLTLPGKLESLDALAAFVLQEASEAGLDYRSCYRLRLAVDEIATNIILYGLDETSPNTLTLSAEADETYLTIRLEDCGTGYNPYEALPPDNVYGPTESRKVGGWGIYLAIWGVDEFHYEREQTQNRSTFRMKRPYRPEQQTNHTSS